MTSTQTKNIWLAVASFPVCVRPGDEKYRPCPLPWSQPSTRLVSPEYVHSLAPQTAARSPHLAPSRSSGPSLAWASCSPADGQRSRPWEPIANHENPGPGDPKGRGRRREPLPSSDRDVLPAGPPSPHHTLGEARLAPVRSLQSPLPNS